MGKEIVCPRCGALVEKRGLGPHQRGYRCQATWNVVEAEKRGLKKAGKIARYLAEAGIELERVKSSVEYRGHHLVFYESYFAPAWAVDTYKELRKKYSIQETIAILKQLKEENHGP
ncbi:MAG: hypothetical protein QW334_03050 [Thermofilum sp.]